jgi:N-acetylmuramic acid 6-phosphate (MurNAc-6-P) etherase
VLDQKEERMVEEQEEERKDVYAQVSEHHVHCFSADVIAAINASTPTPYHLKYIGPWAMAVWHCKIDTHGVRLIK